MPVTSISPIHQGRGGGKGKDGRKSYTAAYVVRTDNAYDEAASVLASVPNRIGDPYNNGLGFQDHNSFCVRMRPEQDPADRHTWRVYVDFEPQDRTRTTISYRFEKKKVAVVGVRKKEQFPQQPSNNGEYPEGQNKSYLYSSTVANSFGDPFDPAPEYEKSYAVVSITRREDVLDASRIIRYVDAVNDSFWAGVKPRCAKIMSIEARHEYVFEGGTERKIWWVTYQIGFDNDTWDIQKLDAGYHYFTETGHAEGAGKKKTFMDEDGNPRIGLLSNEAAGGQKGIALVDLTKPEFKTFRVYPEQDFSVLNLPENPNIFEPLA